VVIISRLAEKVLREAHEGDSYSEEPNPSHWLHQQNQPRSNFLARPYHLCIKSDAPQNFSDSR
jgi:hypothetical protein